MSAIINEKQRDYMLFSNANILLGKVCITQIDGESCHGEFFPTADFAAIEKLFTALIEYANDQISRSLMKWKNKLVHLVYFCKEH